MKERYKSMDKMKSFDTATKYESSKIYNLVSVSKLDNGVISLLSK